MVELSQRLSSLSTRPPTPPKERNKPATDTSSPNRYFANVTHQILLDTPNESPSSSAEYFAGSSGKGTKKVEFLPFLQFHNPLDFESKHTGRENDVRHLPPSRDCKSAKSILKDTCRSSPVAELPALDSNDIPMMLESAKLHLRSTSRSSRLDAYAALLSWISAHDDVSDAESLSNSLPYLLEFIGRDIAAAAKGKGTEDTQLTAQSLKLLIFILCIPGLAANLSDDFCSSVLERSIISLETADLPKILITHYMNVLAKQQFNGKVVTAEKADCLMTALMRLTDRHKGNSIIGLRLRIYQRFLTQAKSTMVARADHWIDHLVSGILSTTKEIRALAITFGVDAGVSLGHAPTVSQACFDLFSRKSPEGQTVVEFLATRLHAMSKSKEDSIQVPQIWGVVILLLRNRKRKLERWPHLKPWLMVLQRCFNSSEPHVKHFALAAWNRFVFVINPNPSTTPQMIKMLRQPIVSQLSRKCSDKNSKHTKQMAQASYCNLLYYSFRPSVSHSQIDLYWEHYVDTIVPESFSATKRDTDRACEILASLLQSEQPRPWNENRANTIHFVKADELPSIEPKWVRSRADRVLAVFAKLIRLSLQQCSTSQNTPLIEAWQSFTKALGEASKQEVKVSIETMTAIAHVLNMIKVFWNEVHAQQAQPPSTALSVAASHFHFLSEGAIANIGIIPFNEPRLLKSSHDCFEAADTPSSRSARKLGPVSSPITHLLGLVVSRNGDNEPVEEYRPIMVYLLDAAIHSSSSRRSQLSILRNLVSSILSGNVTPSRTQDLLWCLIASAAELALTKPRQNDRQSDSPQYAGSEFRDATKVLEIGIHHHRCETASAWQHVYDATCDALRREIGDGGVIIMCTDPLSREIHQQASKGFDNCLLRYSASIAHSVTFPQPGQAIEKARGLLWGTSAAIHKSAAQDNYGHFYALLQQQLGQAYQCFSNAQTNIVINFLHICTTVFTSFSEPSRISMLKLIQHGLSFWIEDRNGLLAGFGPGSDVVLVYSMIKTMWTFSITTIRSMPHTNGTLQQFHHLITSGLMSRHRSIVNDALEFWNGTFGNTEHIEYPDLLRIALVRLRSVADVQLPGLEHDQRVEENQSLPFDFVESQNSEEQLNEERVRKPSVRRQSIIVQGVISKSSSSTPRRHDVRSPSRPSHQKPGNRISKTPPKARLRHDDSQIQFAAVESSPLIFEDIESQMLTEHQKDAKARQVHEAAMFPEFSSSPQLSNRKTNHGLPRLILDVKLNERHDIDPEYQVSPTMPVISGDMEAFLGSSPTPRSSKKPAADAHITDAPSSPPPGVPVDTGAATGVESLEKDVQVPEAQGTRTEALQQGNLLMRQTFPLPCKNGDTTEEHKDTKFPVARAQAQAQEQKRTVAGSISEDTDMQLPSDRDIYVDAPCEPARAISPEYEGVIDQVVSVIPSSPEAQLISDPPHDVGSLSRVTGNPASEGFAAEYEDSISRITDSFESQTSQYSNDDEQIAAQLAVDMERASSQAEQMDAGPQATVIDKKRKRSGSSSMGPSKKSKHIPQVQQFQVIIDTQKPILAKEDCIITDARSVETSPEIPSRYVKRQGSPRPSDIGHGLPVAQSNKKRGQVSKTESAASITSSHATAAEGRIDRGLGIGLSQSSVYGNTKGLAGTQSARRRSVRLNRGSRKAGDEDNGAQDQNKEDSTTAPNAPAGSSGSNTTCGSQMQQDNNSNLSPGKWNYSRLMDGFRNLLGSIRHVTLRAEEEREMTNVLFESVKEVQEAGRRGERR